MVTLSKSNGIQALEASLECMHVEMLAEFWHLLIKKGQHDIANFVAKFGKVKLGEDLWVKYMEKQVEFGREVE